MRRQKNTLTISGQLHPCFTDSIVEVFQGYMVVVLHSIKPSTFQQAGLERKEKTKNKNFILTHQKMLQMYLNIRERFNYHGLTKSAKQMTVKPF